MTHRRILGGLVAIVSVLGVALPTTAATAASSDIGSAGLGDRFFPNAGNGGYDVEHYDLDLAYDAATGGISGTTSIYAHATQRLSQFNLDFRGFDISKLTVNGKKATFTRDGQELVIKPAAALRRGADMHIDVTYSGVPQTVIDPDGAVDGWIPTDDGAIVVSEPQGSPSWFPVNDYPTDKATYDIAMTVPSDISAISNGRLAEKDVDGDHTTWRWEANQLMASYLVTMAIGPFVITEDTTTNGLPVINAIDARLVDGSAPALARLNEIIDWNSTLYGRYPFDSVGVIADYAPNVGFALETQTRPVFTDVVDESTLVHEIAHQWVGNSVSLATWPEIWMNEGFAQYSERLWAEREGTQTTAAWFDEIYTTPADNELWSPAPGPDSLPGPESLVARPVYDRGAMTLQQLRVKVGDDAFFKILKRWTTRNRDANITTKQFINFAERVSGKKLDKLFKTWLDKDGKPKLP